MRVMITGGGTGGHTSPAVAIIEELRRRDPGLLLRWVGKRGNIEERVCKANDIPFRAVSINGWPRKMTPRRLWVAFKLVLGGLRAAVLLQRFRPHVVIGVGGYVSLPLMWIAQRMGIPTVLHEQNKRLGMANRLLAPRVQRMFLSYKDTEGPFPEAVKRVVGNPVRAGFAHPPAKAEAREKLGLEEDRPVVFVCGGSQGAQSLNNAMTGVVKRIGPNGVQFIWMTGKDGITEARAAAEAAGVNAVVQPFFDDMVTPCAAADLIVSRAGASSSAEIAMLGKPAILVPYPHATDNHQEYNARAFEKAGAAHVLLDVDCGSEPLAQLIEKMLANPGELEQMGAAARELASPFAAENIVEEIMLLVFGEAQRQ